MKNKKVIYFVTALFSVMIFINVLIVLGVGWVMEGVAEGVLAPPDKPPLGTEVDTYDTGFDLITTCFTLPQSNSKEFFYKNKIEEIEEKKMLTILGLDKLTQSNRIIPLNAKMVKKSYNWSYPINMAYDNQTKKLWVECRYASWFE
ncbi:MAG: hypothetical protein COA79_19260 [Planctomycetota bacterium]|nr:MAG: hypothetical protein COA79_19260 [Planctomycetota bacterium]